VNVFTIRDEQLSAFQVAMEADFVARLEQHLRKHFSGECADLGLRLGGHLRKAMALARRAGLESERDLCKYASLTLLCGLHFATDSSRAWMGRMLEDESVSSPSERLDLLYAETVRRLRSR
jgi:hypothetical protein